MKAQDQKLTPEEQQLQDKARAKLEDRKQVLTMALILTVKDVRLLLGGVSQAFIYQLLNAGVIRSFKVGDRRMISREALNEYITDLDNEARATLEGGVF